MVGPRDRNRAVKIAFFNLRMYENNTELSRVRDSSWELAGTLSHGFRPNGAAIIHAALQWPRARLLLYDFSPRRAAKFAEFLAPPAEREFVARGSSRSGQFLMTGLRRTRVSIA